MPERLLIDTDVLVDYLRGHPQAVRYLRAQKGPLALSAITVAELYAGVRDGEEREVLDAFVGIFQVLPVTDANARQGGLWRRDYGKSHGVGLADAVIAATAAEAGAVLVTLNQRHFPMSRDIRVPYKKA
ncbi:MAG: type II toxin-antitoxin system VapC family toxin [Phycisphaerae bacterium]|jgi:predicted nucleic acid-binding protein|nr:type II toxin-antitoxin system VapC family toxin [Phycisphaerae bacterium]HNU02369.1 type II toxin-antitoxin system VapC family toxin [Acidobacteriota bacterium]